MKKIVAILLLAAILFCTGCGGGDSDTVVDIGNVSPTPITTATPSPTESPVEVYTPAGNGLLATGKTYSLGVRADGAVLTAGLASAGQTNVSTWNDIVYACAGDNFSAGVTAGGTLLLAGNISTAVSEALNWTNINMVQIGANHILGLKADATVLAAGDNDAGACDVSAWSSIVKIAAAGNASYGLKGDGTVLMAGGGFDVSAWSNITDIAACENYVLGLKADGSAVSAGGSVDVSAWSNIMAISAGNGVAAGLDTSGRVFNTAYTEASAVTGAEQVSAGADHLMVLKNDGTVSVFAAQGSYLSDADGWVLRVGEGESYPKSSSSYAQKIEDAQAVNKDVIGWIQLAGTNIDYPVMKATSDYKYNDYNWKGEKDAVGSIYMYSFTKVQGQFQALTAHNNRKRAGSDTSMFHELHHIYEYSLGMTKCRMSDYCSAKYTDAIPKLTTESGRIWRINIDGEEALWEVFSVYMTTKDSDLETLKDNIWYAGIQSGATKSQSEIRAWIDKQIGRSEIDLGVQVGDTDELLTILTCATTSSQANSGGRLYFFLHRVG